MSDKDKDLTPPDGEEQTSQKGQTPPEDEASREETASTDDEQTQPPIDETETDANADDGNAAGEEESTAPEEKEESTGEEEDSAASPETSGEAPPPPPPLDDPSLHDNGDDGGDDGGDDEDDDEEDEDEDEEEGQMTFMEHLQELRIRLTRIAIAVGVGFLACYGFSKQLFEILMRPLVAVFPPDSKLIFTALPEAFFTYIKVAMVAGVLVTSPYIFYQIWSFVAPGLYEDERKYLVPIAAISGLFFAAGATFGYSVVFPFAFEFFMDFATETIRPMPKLAEYLSFSLKLLFAFGLIFELPLFIFFLARLGIVNAKMLRKFRKYAFLCSFIVSAVLTPPDVVSQTLMAGPLIILYEISIWVAQAFGKKRKEPEEEEEKEDETAEQADTASDKETA